MVDADFDQRTRDRIPPAIEEDVVGGDEAEPPGGSKEYETRSDPLPSLPKRHDGAAPPEDETQLDLRLHILQPVEKLDGD